MRRLALALSVLLILAACNDSMSRGVIIGSDGRFTSNSAKGSRSLACERLRDGIQEELGEGWKAEVRITELPEWVADKVIDGDGDWRWKALSCQVVLTAPAGATLTEAQRAEIERGSKEFLGSKQQKRGENLSFSLKTADAAAVQVAAAPVASAKPAGPRTYIIQPGDTLADLSVAFYGSPQHWRRLAEANPGLDAGALVVGAQITIPPKP